LGILLYASAWFLFALTHSLLARPAIQKKLEGFLGRWYRFLYNTLAALTILAVLYAGRIWLNSGTFAVFESELISVLANGIRLVGLIVLVVAFASYDIGRFVGITQVMTGERISSSSNEPLQRNGLNRWVRHPLYTGAFLMLWGGAVSLFDIWTAVWGTTYLVIGTKFEERKLVKIYRDEYLNYQKEVPRYFPRFGL